MLRKKTSSLKISIALLISFFSTLHATTLSDTCRQATWVTNGEVRAIYPAGDKVYIGGNFTQVGPYTGGAAPINILTGLASGVFPKVNGSISTVVADGNGGWYIGGRFSKVDDVSRNNIAHVLSNGKVDPTWNPNASNDVLSLAVNGATVYAGGLFDRIGGQGGQTRYFIAALDAFTGMATNWNPAAGGSINSIAVNGETVYAGGEFTSIGGQSRNYIAALDAATGLATSWNPNANNQVRSLAINGATVYAGGRFTSFGGQSRNYIAALDAATGMATNWNPNASRTIHSIAVNGATVYAGGDFTSIGGQSRNYIAALDAATGMATTWNPDASDAVWSLAVNGATVYACGFFWGIGGQSHSFLAALDAATGLATSWNPNAESPVLSIAVNGPTVYVTGYFSRIGGQSRDRIAALDAVTGLATTWNPNANHQGQPIGEVLSLAVNGATVYAGGAYAGAVFSSIGQGESHPFFAQFDDSSSTPIKLHENSKTFAFSISGHKLAFQYLLLKAEKVSIRLYNLQGQLKYIPLDTKQNAGNYTVTLQTGEITPGAYLAILQTGNKVQEKKMVLLR